LRISDSEFPDAEPLPRSVVKGIYVSAAMFIQTQRQLNSSLITHHSSLSEDNEH
jgi:hypothetical protein